MRKPTVENKYNLNRADIPNLIINYEGSQVFRYFEDNEYTQETELVKDTIKNDEDRVNGKYNQFWLRIDEHDEGDKVNLTVISNGGFSFYHFDEFYNEEQITNELDLEIQELILETLNELIDKEVLYFPKCIGERCEHYSTHDYMASINICTLKRGGISAGVSTCNLRESIKEYEDAIKQKKAKFEEIAEINLEKQGHVGGRDNE